MAGLGTPLVGIGVVEGVGGGADLGEFLLGGGPGNAHFQLGDVDSEPHMAKTLGGSTTRCHNRSRGTPPAIILRVSALPSTDIRDDNCMDGGTG